MKRCLIICGGPEPCRNVEISENDFVICADGGYDKAIDARIAPDMVVGDLDSIKSDIPSDIKTVTAPAHKDDTDTLLAVKLALKKGFRHICLVGACGGRTDQTIANLSVLIYLLKKGVWAEIIGDECNAMIIKNDTRTLSAELSRYLSVFSVSKSAVVSIEGAEYELSRYKLKRSFPIGVSNEFKESTDCVITAHKGTVLIMMVKK